MSTTTSRTTANATRHKTVQKRMRAVTSCTDCHRRKQKCDRETPCTNCSTRGNESNCRYELFPPDTPGKRRAREHIFKFNATSFSGPDAAVRRKRRRTNAESPSTVLGFSAKNPATSLGICSKALEADGSTPVDAIAPPHAQPQTGGEWYKAYLRELPPTSIIDRLAANFFANVNWQYNPLDVVTFMEDKARWDALPYGDISEGPQAVPAETRFFPAILFQVLALSLLYWDLNDGSCECLKYKSDMAIEDVAREYSETGSAFLAVLEKDDLPRSVIQAKFLRTMFLKTTGKVVESWQSLGETIGGARRLQWHLDLTSEAPMQRSGSVQYLWDCEIRRQIWLNLCCWDAHMSTMLGRPLRITLRDMDTVPPVDASLTHGHSGVVPFPRTELDPPTPLTIQLIYRSIARFLIRISLVEHSLGINAQIQELHEEIVDFHEHLPSYLWVQTPDMRFDAHPGCSWLPDAREAVEATICFAILALHRPHIFKNSKNRSQALKAGLCTLRAEKRAFTDITLKKSRGFSFLFSTFDAAVTAAAIYILFPQDSPRSFQEAVQGVEMVIRQLEMITPVNILASSATKILKALQLRLNRATRCSVPSVSGRSTSSSSETLSDPWTALTSCADGSQPYQSTEDLIEYNLEAIAPPLPLHDLLCNNLSGTNLDMDPFTPLSNGQPQESNIYWEFQGQFGDDAFWNIMNQME